MNESHDIFPFARVLDFSLLIDFWSRQAEDAGSPWRAVAASILERVNEALDLRGPLEDLSGLESHEDLIRLMMSAIYPPALGDEVCAAALVPFQTHAVFMTPAARRIDLVDRLEQHFRERFGDEKTWAGRTMAAYDAILRRFYGIDAGFDVPFTLPVEDAGTGLSRYLATRYDPRFLTIDAVREPPRLASDVLERLIAEPLNPDLWIETLPPGGFRFRGVGLLTATDVTDQVVMSLIRDDLLKKNAMTTAASVDLLQKRLRTFLRQPDLAVGLIGIEGGEDIQAIECAWAMGRSLLLSDSSAPACPHKADSYYASAFRAREPVIVYDLQSCGVCTGFEHHLLQQEIRNLLIHPLFDGDRLVGLLELGSPTPGALNAINALKVTEVETLFAAALKRSMEEREDQVQAVIKQNYTAIHPVVEWRFRQAARNFLQGLDEGAAPQSEEIVFSDVFPLYGLADIRGSSTHRNAAIQADLIEQLESAREVVAAAERVRPMPILGEIRFRVERYVETVRAGLRTEDETAALEYLAREIHPLFDRLQSLSEEVGERVEAYRASLDARLGILYRRRRAFEESVSAINDTVAAVIEEEQAVAQDILPHYFEMFKTDGVDYGIYVGGSLLENGSFDPLYLRNLRLWQLIATCRVEHALRELKPRLPMPLDATHLVLVQDFPLSIRFRTDERQFDVDGAYNIRYEIVKKRIDKAQIRGSRERLTQPGTIAICYSQDREAREYLRYIEYLQATGYLEDGVEELELEDLQGIFGLRALRVTIRDGSTERNQEARTAAIIEKATRELAVS